MAGHGRDPHYPRDQLLRELEQLARNYGALREDFKRLWLAENRENDNFRRFLTRFEEAIAAVKKAKDNPGSP